MFGCVNVRRIYECLLLLLCVVTVHRGRERGEGGGVT